MDQLYLPQFEYAVRASRPMGVMAAYPAYNQTMLLGSRADPAFGDVVAFCASRHFNQVVMRSWGFGNGSVDPLRPASQPG